MTETLYQIKQKIDQYRRRTVSNGRFLIVAPVIYRQMVRELRSLSDTMRPDDQIREFEGLRLLQDPLCPADVVLVMEALPDRAHMIKAMA